jgi:predicted RNA-binding Zn-ribbon protein involved in translation (DUF1610 family)
MIKLQCENCGDDLVHEHGHFFKCSGCGVMYNIPDAKVEMTSKQYTPKYNEYGQFSTCTYVASGYSTYGAPYDETLFGLDEKRSYLESRKKLLGLF